MLNLSAIGGQTPARLGGSAFGGEPYTFDLKPFTFNLKGVEQNESKTDFLDMCWANDLLVVFDQPGVG
jgi:hypothetical protein